MKDFAKMSQVGSSDRRGQVPSVPEEQFLLTERTPRNGVTITPTRAVLNAKRGGEGEKQPFLGGEVIQQPVRLTPAWEDTNLPNDELNFKGVTMEQAHLEMNPPKDRLNLVYLTMMLHGIGTLMPWNMFITAKSYFVHYKLHQDYTGVQSDYATNFLAYIGFASQIPSLLFNWLNIFVSIGGSLTARIVWSILVEVLAFVFTVVLAMTDSSQWPGAFFWATMATVVVLNMANGIYQNTVYGMAAKLPFKYSGAVVIGSNVSGTFTAIISILSVMFAPNTRTAAIYYFITALFVLLACFDTYFALPLNKFYRYHELMSQKDVKMVNEGSSQHSGTPFWKIFKQCAAQCFNVFFIFFVSLAVFPAVHSDIRRSDPEFIIGDKYFVGVTCYLTFNVCAMIGSSLSSWFAWPSPQWLMLPVVLRVVFIPLFAVCNYHPPNLTRLFPVLIHNDWAYWGIAVALGISSGYWSSLAMMYCPRVVEGRYAATAAMFGAACIITGICAGIVFSMALPWFVSNLSWPV